MSTIDCELPSGVRSGYRLGVARFLGRDVPFGNLNATAGKYEAAGRGEHACRSRPCGVSGKLSKLAHKSPRRRQGRPHAPLFGLRSQASGADAGFPSQNLHNARMPETRTAIPTPDRHWGACEGERLGAALGPGSCASHSDAVRGSFPDVRAKHPRHCRGA
ncbi:MAG: hypothetical protein H6Q05_5082 [Acidobacteria bacterium]|nr:hypothetical protein [Acidobacteriota bacterium]